MVTDPRSRKVILRQPSHWLTQHQILALLEADLAARPAEAVQVIPEALVDRLDAVAAEVGKVDPKDIIEGEVSL